MRLDQVTLHLVRLPLVRPFQTSSSRKEHLDHILVHVTTDEGMVGWGECASPVRSVLLSGNHRDLLAYPARFLGPPGSGANVVDASRS